MANSICKFSIFIAFVCLALPLSNEPTVKGEGDVDSDGDGLCLIPSALFHGGCLDPGACNNLCKGAEGAEFGNCDAFRCLCHKKCRKLCRRPSGRFGGPCSDDYACNNLCKGGEGAVAGVCREFKCFCLYDC